MEAIETDNPFSFAAENDDVMCTVSTGKNTGWNIYLSKLLCLYNEFRSGQFMFAHVIDRYSRTRIYFKSTFEVKLHIDYLIEHGCIIKSTTHGGSIYKFIKPPSDIKRIPDVIYTEPTPITQPTRADNRTPDYEYPSRNDIENLFSKLLQKEKNLITSYHNVNLRRNLMIRILETYHNKEFTYDEARIKLNDRDGENGFYQHFEYLEHNHFIERIQDNKFKFCDRVKKWRAFGQV